VLDGDGSPQSERLRATIARTCAYVAVLALLQTWGGEVAKAIDSTVKDTLLVDPK
jgi:hypothetical protein